MIKRAVFFLAVLFSGYAGTMPAVEGSEMKSAVMIAAQENFRDEELLQPKEILERNGPNHSR